jgi:phage tail tape-measure protein
VDKKLASLAGGAIGAPGGPIGVAIGSIVGVVVGKVFAQLARAFGDDEFTPATVTLRVPSLAHTFTGGSATSRPQSVDFKGHNGHYRLTFDWRVFA